MADIKRTRQTTYTGMKTQDEIAENVRILIQKQQSPATIDIDAIVDEVLARIKIPSATETATESTVTASTTPNFIWGSLTSEGADYIVCDIYDPATATTGDSVFAYKPFHIRRSAWHGQTVTYSNGDVISYSYPAGVWGTRTITLDPLGTPIPIEQEIAPDYADDELILLAHVPIDGLSIEYQDVNIAARGWATAVE